MVTYKCRDCGSTKVSQQASAMIPLNTFDWDKKDFNTVDWEWDDYAYCDDCQDDCKLIEEEKDNGN